MNRKIIVIALAVLVVAVGAYFLTRGGDQPLRLSGNVDIRSVNLSFRVGGRLKALQVDEGAKVGAGEVLGELDDQPYRIALADARANLAALEARRALYHHGARPEDIAQAKANVDARQAALLNADQTLARQVQLSGTGAAARRALDDAQSQRDQAAAQLLAAKEQYRELRRGFRKEEVAEADANASRAADARDSAALQLADTVLRSPAAGTILTRAVEPGTMLSAGSTVFTLSLDAPVWVRAYVGETDLGRVPPGTQVHVRSDSSSRSYDGIVGFVSPEAEFTPKNVETRDLRTALVYRLRVVVQNPDAALRQGMPVTVTLAGK
ncbi:MAG: secretion protein HlyD [Burkholderiales bacterium]